MTLPTITREEFDVRLAHSTEQDNNHDEYYT